MTTHEIINPKPLLPVYFAVHYNFNQIVPNHWHNHIEVLYIIKGTMHIIRNDEKYTLHQNDIFVVNSGFIHFTHSPGEVESVLLQIPYKLIHHTELKYSLLEFREFFPYEELKNNASFNEMLHHMLKMKELYQSGEDGFQFLFCSSLYHFIHILYDNYSYRINSDHTNKIAVYQKRLQKVIHYVELHYREQISLNEISKFVGLNTEYFCRMFKKYMSFTFLEYLNLVRLTHIHNDILATNDSIISIQERHGFTNYKVFNRMFKETYGCNPSKLKQ